MDKSLTISLDNDISSSSDYVMIEQKEWPEDVGRTSETQGAMAIGSMILVVRSLILTVVETRRVLTRKCIVIQVKKT